MRSDWSYQRLTPQRPQPSLNFFRLIPLLILIVIGTIPLINHHSSWQAEAVSNGLTDEADFGQLSDYTVVTSDKAPPVYAKSYLLLDAATNEVLTAKDAYVLRPIASTTKMVTALVAVGDGQLDEVITVNAKAATINGSGIGLLTNEKITRLNLLKGLLIQSGNDAAFALAYGNGTEEDYTAFVARMNKFASDHHLTKTHYNDPAGLDDENGHSTAFDLSQLARLILENPQLAKIVATGEETITSTSGELTHQLKNSNRLVLGDSPYYLPGVLGVKTGFTPEAGHCLVSAYSFKGRTLIGVVLNTDEYTNEASAKEIRKLFLWANQNVEVRSYL